MFSAEADKSQSDGFAIWQFWFQTTRHNRIFCWWLRRKVRHRRIGGRGGIPRRRRVRFWRRTHVPQMRDPVFSACVGGSARLRRSKSDDLWLKPLSAKLLGGTLAPFQRIYYLPDVLRDLGNCSSNHFRPTPLFKNCSLLRASILESYAS